MELFEFMETLDRRTLRRDYPIVYQEFGVNTVKLPKSICPTHPESHREKENSDDLTHCTSAMRSERDTQGVLPKPSASDKPLIFLRELPLSLAASL